APGNGLSDRRVERDAPLGGTEADLDEPLAGSAQRFAAGVDTDERAAEVAGYGQPRPVPRVRIPDTVPLVAASPHQAIEQSFRLLCRVASALASHRRHDPDLPDVA